MKKSFIVFAMVIAIIQMSCTKKSDTTSGGAGTLKFTLNGTSYSYSCSSGAIVVLGTTTISGSASGSNANSLNIQMQGVGSGTYTMGASTNGLIMQYLVNSTSTLYELGHASINFNESGSTASGTFSGVLYNVSGSDSVVLTNGSYSGGYNPE
jgi:hypothetical protein